MAGGDQQRITQHKRFPLIKSGAYGTHPNSAFGGTSDNTAQTDKLQMLTHFVCAGNVRRNGLAY